MEIWKLLLFIPACFALNMTPGPNNLLSMNNARCYGFQAAFVAGLGRILAFSGMIALAASGLAVVLYTSETLFFLIKLFALAAGNPKAILIFTAFLPQFVDVSANVNTQFFVLGSTFLVLEMLAISIYAAFGLYLRNWFSKPQMAKRFNKECSVFLALSGANLLVIRQ
ncbi:MULTISPECIES: LysE family translocator [unclassified Vibrio]|uniref:LysE family translocator n=1 Tax=unclassified Vibrio TaxID=2614977 RepID=UPI0035514DAE